MLKTLQLTLREYDTMVRKGAFDELGRRVELIRGEIVEMNPSGPVHDDIIIYLNTWSSDNRDPGKTLITSQTGLDLPDIDSRLEPDVFWVRKKRYRVGHPQAHDVQLAIDVADSSLEKDLEVKRKMYGEVGIVEYWIVDCQSECIHVLRQPNHGDYQSRAMVSVGDTLCPLIAPNALLDIHDLFHGE